MAERKEFADGSYRDLIAWQKAMDLADAVYLLVARFPDDERYALSSQIRRAVVSVFSNIAEGYGRKNLGNYVQHLRIANGSLKEVESQMIFAGRQGYFTREEARDAWDLLQETGKTFNGLIKSLT